MLPPVNSNPIIASAPFWDRVTPDSEFTACSSLYWSWYPNSWSPAEVWSLNPSNTGTLFGGKAVFVANSNAQGLRPYIQAKRATDQQYLSNTFPWRGGSPGVVSIRWRRVNSIYDANSATTNPFIALEWYGTNGADTTIQKFQGQVNTSDRIYPNQFAPNSWHTAVFSTASSPDTVYVNMPKLSIYATSGQIEIDAFDARQL